jgi:hypothetical protein
VDEEGPFRGFKAAPRVFSRTPPSSAPQGLFVSLHILPLSGGIINSGNHDWAFEDEVGVGFMERYSFVENFRLVYNEHKYWSAFCI